jgi:hypothetical protein
MSLRSVITYAAAVSLVGVYAAQSAHAQTLATPADQTAQAAPADQAAPPAPPAPPKHPIWSGTPLGDIQFSGHTELGLSINPDGPKNNQNFGQPFTDGSDAFRMNQTMLDAERDTDSTQNFDWGFKFNGMYGTDSRYTHFYNEWDRSTNSPYQWDVNYLEGNIHSAIPGTSGVDVQIGEYATPLGYEVIDSTGNPFYSHSYIFTYGLPYKHTGVLGTFHVNDTVDVWLGWDTGVNDSFVGAKGNANGQLGHGIIGFGLNNLAGGNLTIIGLAHLGPENPEGSVIVNTATGAARALNVDRDLREYYDANAVWKITDALTSVTELNMVHDDAYHVTAGGAAQYILYTLNDQWTLGARAEAFADQAKNGFAGFVCAAPGSQDAVDAERGIPFSNEGTKNPVLNQGYCGNGSTATDGTPYSVVYGEVTVGATYTPTWPPLPGTWGLAIRPEARFDSIIGGSAHLHPYDVSTQGFGTKSSQVTLAVDATLSF